MSQLVELFRNTAEALERAENTPYGPVYKPEIGKLAGEACVKLCHGDRAKGVALWKRVSSHLGYMPEAAAVALVYAADTTNLVPDVAAPEPS